MPNLQDYAAFIKRTGDESTRPAHAQRAQIIPRALDVTQKAQSVVDHPGWQFFLDKIAERVADVERQRASHMHTMIFGPAMGQDLERMKIEMNTMDAELRALKYATDLVPHVLTVGHEFVTGVVSRVAAGSVAS